MDNSAKQTTINNSQLTHSTSSGQTVDASTLPSEDKHVQNGISRPVPNRGGIPVMPVTAVPSPVSSPTGKEHEPGSIPFPDASKMTGPEIVEEEGKIEKELEALVEKTPDMEKPKIPEEAKKSGLDHAKADTPMPPVVVGVKPLPMSYDEAEFTRKKNKWKDSVAWFAAVVMYHWKKLGISNKKKEE